MVGSLDFVIAGFPKCGTTALAKALDGVEDINVHRRNGRWESPFFLSDEGVEEWHELVDPAGINGHKFTAYAYRPASLERIRTYAPEALVIMCVRDPERALASWREMHRRIATRGEANHFVNESPKSRRFFATCSMSEYYRDYARPLLAYAEHIRNIRSVLGDQRLMVVQQEWLRENTAAAVAQITRHLGASVDVPAVQPQAARRALKRPVYPVAPEIAEELDRYRQDLQELQRELADEAVVLA